MDSTDVSTTPAAGEPVSVVPTTVQPPQVVDVTVNEKDKELMDTAKTDNGDDLPAINKDSTSIMENRNVGDDITAEWANASTFKGASFMSTVINTINTVIGAAIISISNSIRISGVLGAIVLMAVILIPSLATVYYMACATIYTNEDIYGNIATKLTNKVVAVFTDICVMVLNFGIDVAYMNVGFNQIEAIGRDVLNQGAFFSEYKVYISLVIAFGLLFPFCCFKNMDALRFTSSISVCCIVLFVITFVCLGIKGFATRGWDLNLWPKSIPDLSSSLAVFVLCFCSHVNTSKITAEIRHKSGKSKFSTKAHKTYRATTVAYIFCAVSYFFVGVCGYAAFGENIQESILSNLQGGFWWYIYIGYSIVVLSSFPILGLPGCLTIDKYLFSTERTLKRRIIEGFCWTLACFFVWYKIPSISMIFGITGNTCGVLLTFVWPSLFFISMCNKEKKKPVENRSSWFKPKSYEYNCAWIILCLGIVVCIWATYMEVSKLIN